MFSVRQILSDVEVKKTTNQTARNPRRGGRQRQIPPTKSLSLTRQFSRLVFSVRQNQSDVEVKREVQQPKQPSSTPTTRPSPPRKTALADTLVQQTCVFSSSEFVRRGSEQDKATEQLLPAPHVRHPGDRANGPAPGGPGAGTQGPDVGLRSLESS